MFATGTTALAVGTLIATVGAVKSIVQLTELATLVFPAVSVEVI